MGHSQAIASRTERPDWARELLELLGIRQTFRFAAIYPSDKQRHFRQLRDESGVAFEDMLFFDDEMRNIHSVGSLGVAAVHVDRGVDRENFRRGLKCWRHSDSE